ncbi:MAG: TIGR02206 family membrane protein [Phycisphaerae bacterium]|jgi:uncharacterized membrane protein YwaF
MLTPAVTTADAFVSYSATHVGALLTIVAIGLALGLLLRRAGSTPHGPLLALLTCHLLAAGLLWAWLTENVSPALCGYGALDDALPLHLCDLALLVCIVATVNVPTPPPPAGTVLSRARRLQQVLCELAYFWGLAGTSQALLTPDLEDDFPTFAFVRYFATHGGIIVTVLVMTIGLRWRPLPGAVWRTWLITGLAAIPVGLIDWALGTNYMYLCGPPGRPSLYDHLGPWPWPIASMAVLGVLLFGVCYLPFWLTRTGRGHAPFRGSG